MPDSEPAELATLFGTRNSGQILEGLSAILSAQAARANSALQAEVEKATTPDAEGNVPGYVLDPALTRLFNTLFDRAVQMAKLIDPKIASQMGPRLNVNLLAMSGQPGGSFTPQQLMSGVAGELAAKGIDINEATEEQIKETLGQMMGVPAGVIEATVTEENDEPS